MRRREIDERQVGSGCGRPAKRMLMHRPFRANIEFVCVVLVFRFFLSYRKRFFLSQGLDCGNPRAVKKKKYFFFVVLFLKSPMKQFGVAASLYATNISLRFVLEHYIIRLKPD